MQITRFNCFASFATVPRQTTPADVVSPKAAAHPPSLAALPDDVLRHIAGLLAPATLRQLSQVNSQWRALTEPLWLDHWEVLRRNDPTLLDLTQPRQARAAYLRRLGTLDNPPSLVCLHGSRWLWRVRPHWLATAATQNMVATGGCNNTIYLWQLPSGKLRRTLRGHTSMVQALAMLGNLLVSGGSDHTVRLWEVRSGALRHTLQGHTNWVKAVAIDGNTVVSGSLDGTVRLWQAASGQLLRRFALGNRTVKAVALANNMLATYLDWGSVWLWDVTSGIRQHIVQGVYGKNGLTAMACTRHQLVSSDSDGKVRFWHPTSRRLLQTLPGCNAYINSMALVGHHLVTGGADGSVELWDAPLGRLLHRFPKQAYPVNTVALAGQAVIIHLADGTVKTWVFKPPARKFGSTFLSAAVNPWQWRAVARQAGLQ